MKNNDESKRASIDIGSNSVLLLAATLEGGQLKETIANESRVTGLGRGLDKNGRFMDVAMEETFTALSEYKSICASHGIDAGDIIATATEASRVSGNAPDFFKKVSAELGINVKTISGVGEAYYSTKGILLGEDLDSSLAIMDIGGASTEFILVDPPGKITKSFSVPIGSVRVTNWLEEGIFDEKLSKILEEWKEDLSHIRAETLQCVAGTMTSLANMHLDHKQFVESEVHGHVLSSADIQNMVELYKSWKPQDFIERFPFLGKRSSAIKGGLLLASRIASLVDVSYFRVSTYGLRYGTLLEGGVKNEHLFR